MPATGGGRAVHAPANKRSEKSRSVEAVQGGPLQTTTTTQRPGIKHRAYSTPNHSQNHSQASAADDNASLYSQDGEEIADDAFFQRYHFPPPITSTKEEEASGDSSSDTEGPLSPTHMLSRQPAGDMPSEPSSGLSNPDTDKAPAMLDMNIAVIGAAGAGKSSFMRTALGLPDTTAPAMCHRKWTIEGIPYVVRFVEVTIGDIEVKTGNVIEWPPTVQELAVPRVDGAITIYDVTDKESLEKVPDMMSPSVESTLRA